MSRRRKVAHSALALAVSLAALTFFLYSPTPTQAATIKGLKILHVASPEKDLPIRDVYEWIPDVGNTDINTLPVVYLLHGWPGSPQSMVTGYVANLQKAFTAGVRPFIAVFPDGNAKTHIDSEWADSADGKAMIETWLTTRVIPAVEGDHLRTREMRAISGFSMGGYGAGIIGLHHPELFSQIATISGYFVVDDLTGAFSSSKKIAAQTPANYLTVAKNFRWFMAEGKDDYTHPIRGQAVSWAAQLKSMKVTSTVVVAPGGHSYVFVGSMIPALTKWFIWPSVSRSMATPTPAPKSDTGVVSN